jgi:IS1 family transposase/ribosomal protein S14
MIKETCEREGMRLLGTPSRTATALAAPSSTTAKIAGPTRCLGLEPRGYSEEEKEKILRACRERGSKRAISRIFGISRCCVEPLARKKGRKADSVVDGLRPARENDVLELDECWTCAWKRSNKRWLWVALCRRTRQVVAFVIGDRSAKTCARLWSRIRRSDSFRATGKAKASATFGNPTAQCLRKSLRTGRSESPAVNWLTWSVSLGVCGRNWPGTSDARERLPSQNACSISRRNCSWSGTTKPSLNIYPLPVFLHFQSVPVDQ